MPSAHERYDEAIQLQEEGKLEDAVAKLEKLMADEADFALARAALSVFYSRLGRHEEAVEQARKVCELESEDPFSYMSLSIVCQKAGRIGEAEAAMSQAMEKQFAARRAEQ
ncbi:MAG: tetratricopeptide repeat protein [Planctomycetota bacterium]